MAMRREKDDLMYALSCYLEKRGDKPQGDSTEAITALYEMEREKPTPDIPVVQRETGSPTAKVSVSRKENPRKASVGNSGDDGRMGDRRTKDRRTDGRHLDEKKETRTLSTPVVQRNDGSAASALAKPVNPVVEEKIYTKPPETVQEPCVAEEAAPQRREKPRRVQCESCGLSLRKGGSSDCNSCGVKICDSCGEYKHIHRDSAIFFDYRFDFPLCKDCYVNAFKAQEEMGRASTYFRTGNFTYAARHASRARDITDSWPGGEMYEKKARGLLSSIEAARPTGDKQRSRREPHPRIEMEDIKGDKWTKRFVERALARKGE